VTHSDRSSGELGFTLIEVIVAILLLLGGVLATVALVDQAASTTGSTKAREGGTALVRELLEASRAIPYDTLTAGSVAGQLQARTDFADVGGPGWVVERRNFEYTVEVELCLIDDPSDQTGEHSSPAAPFCADAGSSAPGTEDRNADDHKRVTVRVRWKSSPGAPEQHATSTTLIPNPAGALGPSIVGLDPTSSNVQGTNPYRVVSGGQVDFKAISSSEAEAVTWKVDGQIMGTASESAATDGTEWTFTWDTLLPGNTCCRFYDGTYTIAAEATDATGRSGTGREIRVRLNRFFPAAPSGFTGGYNRPGASSPVVDLVWDRNPERDVEGYRVYRVIGGIELLVDSCTDPGEDFTTTLACFDDDLTLLAGVATYRIYALDRDNSGEPGVLRRSNQYSELTVTAAANDAPATPANLAACTAGDADCTDVDGAPASVGTTVLTWDAASDPDGDAVLLYRIYRDGKLYSDRYGTILHSGAGSHKFVDTDPQGIEHDYWVTAVDSRYAESDPQTDPVRR
jgi:type II secretory pathway pseudopilin PulG